VTEPTHVSDLFDPAVWQAVDGFELTDLTYHKAVDAGVVRIAFHRPEVRNAFRPQTVDELYRVLDHARMSSDIGCVLLTGNGPSPKDGGWASVPAATSGSAARTATSTPRAPRPTPSTRPGPAGCTSSRSSG
jgi:1,4-dihydroxy-2-naphthoyl-CoA synthase